MFVKALSLLSMAVLCVFPLLCRILLYNWIAINASVLLAVDI